VTRTGDAARGDGPAAGGDAAVRPGAESDLPALLSIYNHYVVHTPITFDDEPLTLEQRREWLSHYSTRGPHRLLVAEIAGAVVGYACSSVFRPKGAYRTSVETSVYLAPDRTRRGIGSALYRELFAALTGEDVHRAYAGVTLPNPASLALHRRFGFEPAGLHDEVGRKLGRFWSVQWLEKRL
jgi:phosphinothricin acetyltransferase